MNSNTSKFGELRSQAEKMIQQLSQDGDSPKESIADDVKHDTMRLLHELEVHQVELELQNQELEQAQQALVESRNAYKDLFQHAPLAYFIIGKTGAIKEVNTVAEALIGDDKTSLVDTLFVRYIGKDYKDAFHLHQSRVLRKDTDDAITTEMQLTNTAGELLDVRITSTPLKGREAYRCTVVDITDLQRAQREMQTAFEKQEELSKLRSRFLTSMMHELRTPLSIIMSAAQMLDRYYEKLDEDERQKRFDKIFDNVMYLTEVAQEIVINHNQAMFHKTHDGTEREDVLIRDIFVQITEHWQEENRRVDLYFDLVDDAQLSFWDLRTLRRLMYNLLDNAKKYSDDTIRVVVSSNERRMKIEVEDTGRGIPQQDMPHLFEAMFRGSNVGDVRGMGMGLYTVKNTIEALSGTVEIESTPDKGTTVTIKLPLDDDLKDYGSISPANRS